MIYALLAILIVALFCYMRRLSRLEAKLNAARMTADDVRYYRDAVQLLNEHARRRETHAEECFNQLGYWLLTTPLEGMDEHQLRQAMGMEISRLRTWYEQTEHAELPPIEMREVI
ncbi:TPA: hypothetical protein LU109_003613 [Enterobacter hormaechei subsp. xiangfangensis]|nr:hypothetical protein [Enterobacter hormaechei subsp. xiangfangensis]